ncbi:MAG TPA: mechanosensitive ion channel domain-containing protein [Candidatus Acidoferrum sp.]|jgi:small-conductance mechanosensitive channel|nr:mechanosensitive ion channel domain-containing protein [Candidatus Acidoferrum sp.]
MNDFLKQLVSLSLVGKCVAAVVGILFIQATFRVLEQTLPRRFGRADARYKVRKFVVFCGYLAILLFLAVLFEDRLGRLSFALGVAGAGVAVALQDVLASIAGAFSIGFSKLYTVGDRVQIGDIRGDVIDIGLLRTTLMETGNWVSKDLYNGRIARIPNSTVLKGSVFNYSQGFRFIWDEIKVVLTGSSNSQLARAMLLRVAKEAIGKYLFEAQSSWKTISENYQSENPPLEPTVTLVVNAGSFEFTVSYVVDYTKRSAMQDQLFTKIAEEVADSNGRLKWASSAITVISQPATPDPTEPHQRSSILGAGEATGSVNRDR